MQHSTTIAPPAAGLAGRYLTFRLGSEAYGIGVLSVQEIIRNTAVTAVPQLPPYQRGIINLRGRIIPVTDLRRRLALEEAGTDERACIIVTQVCLGARGRAPMGLLVDAVDEVLFISADDISAPPEFGCAVDVAYLRGIARVRGEVKALLDLDRVLGDNRFTV